MTEDEAEEAGYAERTAAWCEAQGIEFDPLRHCDIRSSSDLLGDEYGTSFMAWQLCGKNALDYLRLMAEHDEYEITEAFAMSRTNLYLLATAKP
jgi:hypothetical protein